MNNNFNLGLSHIGLFVKDLEVSKNFYTEVLEMEVLHENTLQEDNGEIKLCFVKKDSLCIEIVQFPEYKNGDSNGIIHHIAINVKDIKSVAQKLRERGIEFDTKEPVLAPNLFKNGCTWINFEGPDGEHLELNEIL